MSLRLSLPQPTPSVSALPSTSPSSTTRSSTHRTVHATSPSRPLMTPLPSWTVFPRSRIATAPSSCSSCATISPSGRLPMVLSLRLAQARRPRLRSQRLRLQLVLKRSRLRRLSPNRLLLLRRASSTLRRALSGVGVVQQNER